jgi:hypothetical protein
MKPVLGICLISLFILGNSPKVLAEININGQFKPKLEYRDGYKQLKTDLTDPAALVSQRTRLNLDFSNSYITTRISVQDVRVWGDELLLTSTPRIGLHEAWVDLKLDKQFDLKIGRQELVYDDERVLGNSDWVQSALSHDAVVGRYESEGLKLHLGGAFNQSSSNAFGTYYISSNYKGLGFLWFENKIDSNMRFSLLGLSDVFQENDTVNNNYARYTLGGNYYYNSKSFDAQATGYYQTGKTVKNQDISAYMFSLQGYWKSEDWKIGAGIDYLSGNDAMANDTTKYGAFNTLYATNHKFYGYMDYFTNIPKHTHNGGLVDIYVKLKYNFAEKWFATLDYHNFSLDKAVIDPLTSLESKKGLASEIDLVLTHKFSKDIKFQFGYSYLLPDDALKLVQGKPNGENSQWAWIAISVTPEFFSSK